MFLTVLLAGQRDIALGNRNGLDVLALSVQPTHLGSYWCQVIGALRPRRRGERETASEKKRNQKNETPHRTPPRQ